MFGEDYLNELEGYYEPINENIRLFKEQDIYNSFIYVCNKCEKERSVFKSLILKIVYK